MAYNLVVLQGNVTRDIELKYTQGGTAIADVGLAVNRVWKDANGNKQEEVTFVDITFFGRTAEIAGEFVSKGRPLMVQGRLKLDQWQDKNTGDKRSKLKVIGEQLVLLGSRGDGDQRPARDDYGEESQEQREPTDTAAAATSAFDDADCPF